MKAVVQRVSKARVTKKEELLGVIEKGLMVLVGIEKGDGEKEVEKMGRRIKELRIFSSAQKEIDCSVEAVAGDILLVPQFTLCTNDEKSGRRPSFGKAAPPEKARNLYLKLVTYLRNNFSGTVATGEFGAAMKVSLINDGPVTIILQE